MPPTVAPPFRDTIDSEDGIRALLGTPSELVIKKQLPALDAHCRAFIALAPFVAVATTDANGGADVSPRGDAPGFVRVLDERRLVIPERPGNRRADTLRNVVQTGAVGLLFLIPGFEETLRVNGRAWLTRDPDLLASLAARGKPPLVAIGVQVDEAFLHCAKAFKRSRLWEATTWPARATLPSLACMLFDQARPPDQTVEDLERQVAESYATRLY
ncbi:MAG: pyridoxamine 5'-phosphate oxidase family protein [Chloroflexi bacterium]|nr:pyridoxamine 5'-phosphate oxidase family protein [Chloroflexota bacterium]